MKKKMKKISNVLKNIFGIGIMIALFGGGLTFFAYIVALIVGGDVAVTICYFTYKQFIPVMVYISTTMVLLGLVAMYFAGEFALTAKKEDTVKHKGEV